MTKGFIQKWGWDEVIYSNKVLVPTYTVCTPGDCFDTDVN